MQHSFQVNNVQIVNAEDKNNTVWRQWLYCFGLAEDSQFDGKIGGKIGAGDFNSESVQENQSLFRTFSWGIKSKTR